MRATPRCSSVRHRAFPYTSLVLPLTQRTDRCLRVAGYGRRWLKSGSVPRSLLLRCEMEEAWTIGSEGVGLSPSVSWATYTQRKVHGMAAILLNFPIYLFKCSKYSLHPRLLSASPFCHCPHTLKINSRRSISSFCWLRVLYKWNLTLSVPGFFLLMLLWDSPARLHMHVYSRLYTVPLFGCVLGLSIALRLGRQQLLAQMSLLLFLYMKNALRIKYFLNQKKNISRHMKMISNLNVSVHK